jgi:hypothetical protein
MIPLFVSTIVLITRLIYPLDDGARDQDIINKLADYSWNYPHEKVYLHTDKPFYVPGENLWFKAYLTTGQYHGPDTIRSVLYVELIDRTGTIAERRAFMCGKVWDGVILTFRPPCLRDSTF